jgi:putative effector of murein hydrolase
MTFSRVKQKIESNILAQDLTMVMNPRRIGVFSVFGSLVALSTLSATFVDAESSTSAAFSPRQHAVLPSRKSSISSKTASDVVFDSDLTAQSSDASSPPAASALAARGGAGDSPTSKEITGVVTFILIEVVFRKIFKANGIRFPAQLAGCVALFAFMILAQAISPGSGDSICGVLAPGAGLLAKWMGVFFVPGLTMLPLAPSIGSSIEIVKTLGVVVLGFFYSLFTVTYAVLAVRKFLGTISEDSRGGDNAGAVANKPYSQDTLKFLVTGTVLSAAVSIAATKTDNAFQKPLETLFLGFATLASYVWGARLPSGVTKIVNPLLSSAMLTLLAVRFTGMATGSTFIDVLKSYTSKKLRPMEAGAGDLLLFLLSPSVISFAIGIYKGKNLIAANLPAILTGVFTGSVGGLFGTAAFARLIKLGGPNGAVVRLAAVPRSTQTALGMMIAEMLGGDVAIAATIIILTGIFGGMIGVKVLDAWGVKDSVSRGLGIGSAGLSLGVVSIKGEQEAFAFAGLCLVLTAVSATCLASIPAVADLVIKIAGGAPAM